MSSHRRMKCAVLLRTLGPPFPSTSSSSHSSFTSCTSSTTLRAVASLCTQPTGVWTLLTTPTSSQVVSPTPTTSRRLPSSPTQESLTHPQFSKQGFLEDVEYDDTALEDMLREAHRFHVYHSQREGLSVGQSSSSVSERTGRPVVERTGGPVKPSGRELNVANAQIRNSVGQTERANSRRMSGGN